MCLLKQLHVRFTPRKELQQPLQLLVSPSRGWSGGLNRRKILLGAVAVTSAAFSRLIMTPYDVIA
jgi:hypothetical protein